MPVNKEALIRYRIIDSALRDKQKPFPTLEELVALCEKVLGKTFSSSTIQKDIYALRNDEGLNYHAPIKFNKGRNGYYYAEPEYTITSIALTEDEINAIEFAAGILEQFKDTELHDTFDHAVEKIMETLCIRKVLHNDPLEKTIQLEKAPYFKGSQLIPKLLETIKRGLIVSFDYHFFEREVQTYLLHPYLLKEYRNRWYLIGFSPERNAIRTFGLDRIENLQISKDQFKVMDNFDPIAIFKHSFGISLTDNQPEEVILLFTPFQAKYIKNQPIHHTQEILCDNDQECQIQIKVMISDELKMQVLSYGNQVKVLKPDSLAKKIRSTHLAAAELYEMV